MDLSKFVKMTSKKNQATRPMVDFATKIADELELDYPDFADFGETKEFIDNNVDDYNQVRFDNKRGYRR